MDATNENARPGNEPGRAQEHNSERATAMASLGVNDADPPLARKPSFDAAPLIAAGLTLVPLNGKAPRDARWQERRYDSAAVAAAAEGRHNLGVRISGTDLMVIDADPRNYRDGIDSFERLVADFGIDLRTYPVVRTGGGGVHVYMRRPAGAELAQTLDGYPGIDLKTSGQVVAPGSVHPDTGAPYVSERMELLALEYLAPRALLDFAAKSRKRMAGAKTESGLWTPDELAKNLANLNPDEFITYGAWFDVMLSAHFATNGAALDEFVEWSTQYTGRDAASPEQIADKWRGLTVGDGRVTHRHICKLLHDRGRRVHDEPPAELDFEAVEDESTVARWKRPKRDWRALSIEELLNMPPPRWIVEGALQEESAAVLFGPPGEGKSFVALDIALCMAAGVDWHGHAVVPGNVLYVAAEGAAGLGVRVQAWIKEHGLGDLPNAFQLFTAELTLADREMADDFLDFVADEAEVARPRLIVVDTLSQTATGFEENSNTDMAKYFKRVQALVNMTGATVLVIHHTGKDTGKAERGAIAIRGNIDTSIEAKRVDSDGKRYVALHARKQKNDEERQITELEMVRREFAGRDGTMTSSLVLLPSLRSFVESDASFLSDEVRLHEWIAKHMGAKESAPLGDLLEPLESAGIIAGKERTLRTKLIKLIGEGFDDAKRCPDGTRIWLERDAKNPAKGPITVRKVKGEE